MGPFKDGWTREQVEAVLKQGQVADLLYVPIVVGMAAPDCGAAWAADICFRLCEHEDEQVRANSLLALGHIARTAGELDLVRAKTAIARGKTDPTPLVQAQAKEAEGDIKVFMGVKLFP